MVRGLSGRRERGSRCWVRSGDFNKVGSRLMSLGRNASGHLVLDGVLHVTGLNAGWT